MPLGDTRCWRCEASVLLHSPEDTLYPLNDSNIFLAACQAWVAAQSGLHLSPTFFHPFVGSCFAAVALLRGCCFGQPFGVTGHASPSLCVCQQLKCSPRPLLLLGSLVSSYFLFKESAAASREQLFLRLLTTVPLCNEEAYIKHEPDSRSSSGFVFSCKYKEQRSNF